MKDLNRQYISWRHPSIVAEELTKTWGENGFIWLDGDGSELGRWVKLASNPIDQICCRGLPITKSSTNPFEKLKKIQRGHWTGWLSYEASAWIEPSNPWRLDSMATLWMASHDPIFKFDLKKQELWLEGFDQERMNMFVNWIKKIPITKKSNLKIKTGISINDWKWLTSKDEYSRNVEKIKQLISEGDLFQANLTACCTTSIPQGSSALELFKRLRCHCPAPFSGVVIGDNLAKGEAIISASPERFLKVHPSGEVETRPIKGTRPRYIDPKKDSEVAAELISSEKDRAENIMIVDLLRNDLGRVCTPGSIHVPQLVGLESYSQVHHLTSVIKGSLKPNKTWIDLLMACWPGGSISGAPKLRACQRLNEIEPTTRGPYCGSLITRDWDGTFDSNILIRSLLMNGKMLRAHAGCGIVADSDPNNEAEELTWKLIPLLNAME